ncbi:ACT domain-containing protein ACR4-like isoform X1 [Cucumis melo var. makuwa]|uniref:ACT domain-containing protein ACR4-like isoform X1 n=1 Tax=Cucumis melo var. makuwa TaxID=1194695 RepID=A0A5D3DC96_CUCMM|nr:ACT domain-containing protein ACR4-like isoform X1 [Cucumis melo var. makuwa]TYK21758.1 ACT domain-containing protein ACR4-like isoform X1 [Cucumis melo var. makuwa]TYK22064.1 ACT domain-containing protein ACR4-like isoform X1 [Cucumis melo var. makuwa]
MDCWSLSLPLDDEFKKLVNRMNPHRVTIDNDSIRKATPIKVDSANKRGSLLEVVQNSISTLRHMSDVVTFTNICSLGKVSSYIHSGYGLKILLRGRKLRPERTELVGWFSKGLAHVDYMLNHFLEAIAVVKQALDVDPTNLEMLHALGVSHANGVVELLFITILRGYDVCISKRLWQGGNTAGPGVGDITKQMTAIEEMVASEYN